MRWPGWYPPVLAYHRVHPQPGVDTPTLSPEIFERHMSLLAKRWQPIPLGHLVAELEKGKTPSRRGVAVTFDDGTEDTFTHAFPVLVTYRIPATVFLIVSNIGRPGSLTLDQIRQMKEAGISFGSHTLSHAYLPSLSPPTVRDELVVSRQRLTALGLSGESVSYPGGGFTPKVVQHVQEAGYRFACTTNRGLRRLPVDRWAIRRITMHGNATSSLGMWIRCSGYYGINRRVRNPS